MIKTCSHKYWKRILILFFTILLLILIIICSQLNKEKYQVTSKKVYSMNEEVTAYGYQIKVLDYQMLDAYELEEKYPGSTAKFIENDEMDNIGIAIVKCEISFENKDFPVFLSLQSDSFSMGMMPYIFSDLNPGLSLKEQSLQNKIVYLPFRIKTTSFYHGSVDRIKNMNYELVISETPILTVDLN